MALILIAIFAGAVGVAVGIVIGISLAIENLKKDGKVIRDEVGALRLLKKHGRRRGDRERRSDG